MRVSVIAPRMEVGRLVVRPPVTVPLDMSIRDAAEIMRGENVSCLLVGGPEAIVTERDLTLAWTDGASGEDPVYSLASACPVSVDATAGITAAAAHMLRRNVRHLVVMDEGSCVGVVSLRALLAVLLQAAEPELWLTELRVAVGSSSEFWLG